jgi:hypothetical protein
MYLSHLPFSIISILGIATYRDIAWKAYPAMRDLQLLSKFGVIRRETNVIGIRVDTHLGFQL